MTVDHDRAAQDLELVHRTASGDERAFEELVSQYQHSVLNTIHRYAGDYGMADDIAQEVFLIVWTKAGSFKGRSKFSTWLYRIVVNQCLQSRRRTRHPVVSLDAVADDQGTPDSLQVADDPDRRERAEAVRRAMTGLPERQRIALVLSHYEGRPYKEIAEIMDTSLSAVKSLLFYAKENLRRKLVDQGIYFSS